MSYDNLNNEEKCVWPNLTHIHSQQRQKILERWALPQVDIELSHKTSANNILNDEILNNTKMPFHTTSVQYYIGMAEEKREKALFWNKKKLQ